MRNYRVLIINPPNQPFSEPSLLIEPIDALSLASWVKSLGHDVSLLDMDRAQLTPQEISGLFSDLNPEFTVIPFDYHVPLYTTEAAAYVRDLAALAASSGSRVILGGKPASYYPACFLGSPNTVIIRGEMEPALEELLCEGADPARVSGLYYLGRGGMISTPYRGERFDPNRLPIPDRALLDLGRYIDVRSLLSSRGCVERCTFCPVRSFWGSWRGRKSDLVVDEIEELVARHAAQKIIFLDDHALADEERMRMIAAKIRDRGLKVSLGCLATARSAGRPILDIMRRAGFCWIHIGAESGAQEVLDRVGKGVSVQCIQQAILDAKAAGMRVRTSWIMDAPGTSAAHLDRTIDLILDTEPEEIRIHYLTLRAGSLLSASAGNQDGYPDQYLHSGAPRGVSPEANEALLKEKVSVLTAALTNRGYLTVANPRQWEGIAARHGDDAGLKFISFCPARYGLGWRI